MRKQDTKLITVLLVCTAIVCVPVNGSAAGEEKGKTATKTVLLNRIDFGNSYIMGQSIKSGAVYLLQRKQSEIKTMLKYRTDYRAEILEDFPVKPMQESSSTDQP